MGDFFDQSSVWKESTCRTNTIYHLGIAPGYRHKDWHDFSLSTGDDSQDAAAGKYVGQSGCISKTHQNDLWVCRSCELWERKMFNMGNWSISRTGVRNPCLTHVACCINLFQEASRGMQHQIYNVPNLGTQWHSLLTWNRVSPSWAATARLETSDGFETLLKKLRSSRGMAWLRHDSHTIEDSCA